MKKLKLPEIKNKGNVILYACILTGVILRFFQLGMHPVTSAEYTAVNFSSGQNILYVLFNNAVNNTEAPLYYLITYIWTLIFGVSEVSVRILPAVFGIVSIFIVNKLTRSFYSEKVSVIATSFFALSPFQIYFSQVSTGQTLLLMASLLMIYYFMLSVKYNSFVMGPFTFWAIISLYCGHMGIFVLLILNIILFVRYKEEIRINLWIRSQIFILLAWLPLIVYLIKGGSAFHAAAEGNIFLAPFISFKNLLLGHTIDFNFLTIAIIAAVSLFLLIGVITCRTIKEKRMTDIMSLLMFTMIISTWLFAMLNKSPYSEEGLLIAGAMLIIIISIGISHLSRKGMILFTLITITIFFISIYNYFSVKKWQAVDYKPLYIEIMHSGAGSDIIVHSNAFSYAPFEFYNKLVYKRNFPDYLEGIVPEFRGNAGIRDKWRKAKLFLNEKAGLDIYGGYDKNILTRQELKSLIKPGSRVWLVSESELSKKLADSIWAKGFSVEKEFSFNKASLELLVKK